MTLSRRDFLKAIGGAAVVAVLPTFLVDGCNNRDTHTTQNRLISEVSWGAFPHCSAESIGYEVRRAVTGAYPPYVLEDLSAKLGFKLESQIVYVQFNDNLVKEYEQSNRKHAIPPKELETIRMIVDAGQTPRLALEPMKGFQYFIDNAGLVKQVASDLNCIGPCTMRFASECNLYDNPYFINYGEPVELTRAHDAFALLKESLQRNAPNISLSYSPMLPNFANAWGEPDTNEIDHILHDVIWPQLDAVHDHIDFLSCTAYFKAPGAVEGLRRFIETFSDGYQLGIDELGCERTDTLVDALAALESLANVGRLRYVNLFDMYVKRGETVNRWDLCDQDYRVFIGLASGKKVAEIRNELVFA